MLFSYKTIRRFSAFVLIVFIFFCRGNNKKEIISKVKAFIQNVHHFRDDCLAKSDPPFEHIAIFDEAQRAWNEKKLLDFMKRRKKISNFHHSEPEFLISCMDRHQDWAVIVCLVGGGQEINTGEAGIGEWLQAIQHSFPNWNVYISPQLTDSEYNTESILEEIRKTVPVHNCPNLHLSASIRSFRSEKVSLLVKQILDLQTKEAKTTAEDVLKSYPIVLTRSISKAKQWLHSQARGSERYGLIASSNAIRLQPEGIFVKNKVKEARWFLSDKDDIRSSNFLEDATTEFVIQGLELNWTCLCWDADLCLRKGEWTYRSFRGTKWNQIKCEEMKNYLKNAYRVLLTRARQGMVIFIPQGDENDKTRLPKYYDRIYQYLKKIGIPEI